MKQAPASLILDRETGLTARRSSDERSSRPSLLVTGVVTLMPKGKRNFRHLRCRQNNNRRRQDLSGRVAVDPTGPRCR